MNNKKMVDSVKKLVSDMKNYWETLAVEYGIDKSVVVGHEFYNIKDVELHIYI